MLCRLSSFSLLLRRISIFPPNRIYASSTAPESDEDKENKDDNDNDKDEDASIASMIGPYVSSKQIAFHTGQFDSEQIQKKNKQAFLVCYRSMQKTISKENFSFIIRMLSMLIKFNFQIVVVMLNLSELHFDG